MPSDCQVGSGCTEMYSCGGASIRHRVLRIRSKALGETGNGTGRYSLFATQQERLNLYRPGAASESIPKISPLSVTGPMCGNPTPVWQRTLFRISLVALGPTTMSSA